MIARSNPFLRKALFPCALIALAVSSTASASASDVPTEIVNNSQYAKALLISDGQGAGCYAVNSGNRITGPVLRAGTRYTLIGMASAKCAKGTGIASVNREFVASPHADGAGISITILDTSIKTN